MAKVKGSQDAKKDGVFFANSEDHGPADIAAANADGKKVIWSVEKFVEIPEELYKGLSRENQIQYSTARQLNIDWEKSPKEGYGHLDVINIHSNNATNRLKMAEAPKDVHIFYPRVEEAYSAKRSGYKYVDVRETAFKALMPSHTPPKEYVQDQDDEVKPENRHFVFNRETGKPEHVAMYIPKDKYDRHLKAMSAISRGKVQSADAALQDAVGEFSDRTGTSASRYSGLRAKSKTSESAEEIMYVPGEGVDKV